MHRSDLRPSLPREQRGPCKCLNKLATLQRFRKGFSVHRWASPRVPRLFAHIDLAHGDGPFARLVSQLVKVDLFVLDDCGPDRLSALSERRLLISFLIFH